MRLWIVRLLIGIVTAWNLQAGVIFILSPAAFVQAFELSGVQGETAIRGVGVLFLMWNVPYLAALWNPVSYRLALIFALVMQFIGVVGESFILFTLPLAYTVLHASLSRFITFDGAGLLMLTIALLITGKEAL